MKKTLVLLFLLIIGIGGIIAQPVSGKATPVISKQTELDKLQKQVDDAEKTFQDYFDTDRSLKTLKELVKNNVKKRHENVKTALETIINLQEKQLADCRDSLAVFRFFTNQEETIFADTTLELNGWNNKLTGTYLTQYTTITLIRKASLAISEVENTISKMTNQKQDKGWNDEQLKTAIALEIGHTIRTSIAKQLDDIDKRDLNFLSSKQKEYYRNLSERYDKIFNTYF